MTMTVPLIMSAADDKKYAGHMTMNFEKDGYFTYLGKLPEVKLAADYVHFNMCNWSHLGGREIILNYYGPKASTLILPANGTNKEALSNKWFSIIMPTRDPGNEIIVKAETE